MKYFWWILSAIVVLGLITLSHRFFTVDKTTYTQVERTEAQHIETKNSIAAPKDLKLDTVFPYLPAPKQ
jgi:hypothetical protein